MGAARTGAARRAVPYRVFWQTDAGLEALEFTLDQLQTWLLQREISVDVHSDGYVRTPSYRLVCMHRISAARHDFQARLVESKGNGKWTAELTLASTERHGGWLQFSVNSSAGLYVGTPRLVRYLLVPGLFRDGGSLRLTPNPKHVSVGDVEGLAEVLTDVDRQGLAFVAGCDDGRPFETWRDQVRRWTKEVTGLGEVFVLDPLGTRELAKVLGANSAVRPFTLRTYLPGVDPAVAEDHQRHRYLSTARLDGSTVPGIARLLGRLAREHNAARPLPDSARGVLTDFGHMESKILARSLIELRARGRSGPDKGIGSDTVVRLAEPPLTGIVEAAPVSGQVAQGLGRPMQEVALVQRVSEVDTLSQEDLTRRFPPDREMLDLFEQELAEKQAAIGALQDELSQLNEALFESQVNLDDEAAARSHAVDEVHWLRGRLRAFEQWEIAYAPIPADAETDYPNSFEDLLERLGAGALRGVVFTGERKWTEELDAHYDVRTAVRGAWDACLALADYLRYRAQGHNCNVHMYLQEASSEYRRVPLGKHASDESESVKQNPTWADERCLPVPKQVDASGSVHMFAHFKCARVGMVSPRLHYHDDSARTGKVYIGYIGRHLTTKGTN